ncbi:MAG TPA: sn-glycerol-3-phosphate ABC transporter ATP-binding protein UgpC [Actinomycetota bacterium]|nr:sn-glycerol-3-phosphate ABC transporter ATP-binding protein UgpC [Actinomycetota bacterium]
MARIALEGVTKVFDDGTEAVTDLDLEVGDGEFMVLVGPSGCGKSTALRMIAGLEDISAGTVTIGDRVVNELPPKERDVAMVFQNYALYPHMSVHENMAFALKVRKMPTAERDRKVRDAARILGLTDLLDRRPKALSGGQRQRVAMGRAIVREPRAFLMDEPLSNLDAKLRVQMRAEIARIQADLGTTTVYVTHDQTEAMTMGDRVAVLRDGLLQQVDEPQVLYDQPRNLFVAGFIGSPAMNLVEATLTRDDGTVVAAFGPHRLELAPELLEATPGIADRVGRPVVLGIRPEDIEDASLGSAPSGRRMPVTVDLVEALGSELLVHFDAGAPVVITDDDREMAEGLEEVATAFVGRLDPRSRARQGDTVELAIDTARVHVFDPATGDAIR